MQGSMPSDMMTDPTHLHLLLNHFPTVGFVIALGLLGGSLVAKSDDLKQAGLVVIVGIALLTIPAYVTGHAAQMVLADMPDVSQSIIDTHEGAPLSYLWC